MTVAQAASIRIMSWNLRVDSMPDNIAVQQTIDSLPDPLTEPALLGNKGERPWSTRRIKVAQRIISENVVLAGLLLRSWWF